MKYEIPRITKQERREAGASQTDTERNIKAFNKLRRKISQQTSRKGYFFKTGADIQPWESESNYSKTKK